MGEDTPLAVLLRVMQVRMEAKDYAGAVAAAKAAAPYLHGRAAAVRPPEDLAGMADDELGRWFEDAGTADDDGDPEEPG